MLFNSAAFALFFVVVYGLYLISSLRWQNRILLVASYIFYGAWDWRFLSLLFLSTFIDYSCALQMERTGSAQRRKLWLSVSLVTNLGMLGVFKYFNFFAENFAVLAN